MVFDVFPCLLVFVYHLYAFFTKLKFVLNNIYILNPVLIMNTVQWKKASKDEYQYFLLRSIYHVFIS